MREVRAVNVGQLTFNHLGRRATIANDKGGFISGILSSIEFSWGELSMGMMAMRGGVNDGLRLTIGGWPIVVPLDSEIEVIA
jgi:hypothetical protein